MKVGIAVECAVCRRMKRPLGRAEPSSIFITCSPGDNCPGYLEEPLPGSLWPGETEEEFGHPVGSNGVEGRERGIDECPECGS
jgi:hypothetical protein